MDKFVLGERWLKREKRNRFSNETANGEFIFYLDIQLNILKFHPYPYNGR